MGNLVDIVWLSPKSHCFVSFQDSRFNSEIDMKMGYKTQSILSMPIKDSEGEVIGVAQAVNKVVNRNLAFNEHDEKVNPLL